MHFTIHAESSTTTVSQVAVLLLCKKTFQVDAFWKDNKSTKNVSDYMKHDSYLLAEYLPYINIRAVTFFFLIPVSST